MEKSRKAIIFGCGGVGKEVKRKLELNGIEVIAFSDNDEKKWKDTFEDRIVICPEDIRLYSFDVVAIGLYKAVKEVKIQLLNLGIAEDCIIIPIEPVHIFKNPLPVMGKIEELKRADYESETTKAYLQKKVVIDDKEFLSKLDDLKKTLKSNNIPREKVCIVSGAVLQAYGLRKSKKSKLYCRERRPPGRIPLPNLSCVCPITLYPAYSHLRLIRTERLNDVRLLHLYFNAPYADMSMCCRVLYCHIFCNFVTLHQSIRRYIPRR